MKKIKFTGGNWEKYFEYAYTKRFPFDPEFEQEEDCLVNKRNPGMSDGFDYTTIMTKEKYGEGTKLCVICSFEKYGAPLITLTDSPQRDENGKLRYGACYEVVLWENGINVWDLYEENSEIKWKRIMAQQFELKPEEKHEILIELKEDKCIRVVQGDYDFILRIENLPDEMYFGITGCENINRFYEMSITNGEEKCNDT